MIIKMLTSLLLTFGVLTQICLGSMSSDSNKDGTVNLEDLAYISSDALQESEFMQGEITSPEEVMAMLSSTSVYPVRPQILPVYIDCFDDSSEWSDLFLATVQDVNEFNGEKAYLCGDKSFSSILITTLPQNGPSNYHHILKTFYDTKDFSFCHIACRIKVPQGDGPTHFSNIEAIDLRFWDERDDGVGYRLYSPSLKGYGWHETLVTQADNFEGSGDIDWTNIKKISIVVRTKENSTPQVIVDRLMLFGYPAYSNESKPIVIHTFDDTWLDQYDAAAYLSGKSMTGTFYIIGKNVDSYNRLTLAQLKNLRFAGHLIANHTWDHKQPFEELPPEEQRYQIIKMQQWLCINGFGDGARIIATPGNAWNPQMDTLLRPYFSQIRHTLSGRGMRLNPLFDKTHLQVSAVDPNTATTQVEKMLNNPNPSIMVIYLGHGMTDYMTEFTEYIDYVYDQLQMGNLRVYNSAEFLNL